MTFLGDFLKRKETAPTPIATPTAEPEQDELSELHDILTMRRAQIAGLEDEVRRLDKELEAIGRLAGSLKVSLTENDGAAAATARLDELDRQELGVRRKKDGLASKISATTIELQPLEQRAAELSRERDVVRQDFFVADMKTRTGELLDEIEVLWRQSCSLAYGLMTLIQPSSGAVVLDDQHKAEILALRNLVNRRLLQLRLMRTNELWQTRGEGGFPPLTIIPARPRESLAVEKSA
jgi:hypothetical protein